MKKLGIFVFVISFSILIGFEYSEATRKDYYRTYEIIDITENGLILQDRDSNVVEVIKDPKDYKVGYKVRYDKVRKRLRGYRWQDYKVLSITGDKITLQHKSGETLKVRGNYVGKYTVGDQVRYDSFNNKLQLYENQEQ